MSSKKDSTASNGSATAAAKYEARLCHVVKRPDFDGYGFNLHAEKGRPGQYIGKVDDGSPAEAAGLRQGDRIIEVNGTNITTETHKKVVELIKAVPNETKLLVIDPRADAAELKAAIARSKSGATNGVDVNDNSKQAVAEGGGEQHMMMTNGGTKDSLNENKHDVNNGTNGNNNNHSHEEVNNKKNSSTSSSDKSANKSMMMTNGGGSDASAKKQPVDQIIEDTKALSVSPASVATAKTMTESNGSTKPAVMNGSSTAAANGSASKEGPKLNLNMTAAELRAQLAARKKYDPKNDVCDLRKKYEIIQKM